MNKLFSTFFGKQLTQILEHQKYVDARVLPKQLLSQLNEEQGKSILIKHINRNEGQTHLIRVLSVVGIMLLYSDGFYHLIQQNLRQTEENDTWIKSEVINPFIRWLQKCCETSNLFRQLKQMSFTSEPSILMERLPYLINILNKLLNIVKVILKFGRYFNLKEGNKVYLMFSQILMLLTNKIYAHLKRSLQQLLFNEKQESIDQHQGVLKWVFSEVLPDMNETLKRITLNKHFSFYQKGIVTKTIKIQEYNAKTQKIINDLLDLSSKSKSTIELQELQTQIFPDDGSFNESLFVSTLNRSQTSEWITKESTNRSTPIIQRKRSTLEQYRLRQ